MNHTTISLTDLVTKSKEQLDLLGYAEETKRSYTFKWKHFLKYAEQKGKNYFSKEFGNEYLEECYGIKGGMKLSKDQSFKVRAIKVLGDMLEYNSFLRRHQKPSRQVCSQFYNVLQQYEFLQLEKKLKKSSIRTKKSILVRFLNFLDKQELTDIKELTSYEILSYLRTLKKYRSNTKSEILYTLRNFLSFLYSEGYINASLCNLFPVIFKNRSEKIPSYYSQNEIHTILSQIDRNCEYGRRDYLVLLLAVQFGMRAGDIRELKFENLKWSRNTIEFNQQKTKVPLQLPITEEFKYAFADYLKNSRPKNDDTHILVKHKAPFQPYGGNNSFYNIPNKYMALADIKINNRKHGLHSMRHSTASNLLQNNTPYPVITGILGHKNSNTTKLYLRIDIQQLRTVALEVPNEK